MTRLFGNLPVLDSDYEQTIEYLQHENARCKAIIIKFCNEFPHHAKWFGADEMIDLSYKDSAK